MKNVDTIETDIVKIKELSEEKAVCPIVFKVYKALKEELWHHESLNFDE